MQSDKNISTLGLDRLNEYRVPISSGLVSVFLFSWSVFIFNKLTGSALQRPRFSLVARREKLTESAGRRSAAPNLGWCVRPIPSAEGTALKALGFNQPKEVTRALVDDLRTLPPAQIVAGIPRIGEISLL